MDLSARLQQLEQLVLEAKSMPLSSSVLVSRDELLQMILEMQESIPEEIKQARWIVKDREDLLGKARAEGERIVEQAHEDQRRLALKEEAARVRRGRKPSSGPSRGSRRSWLGCRRMPRSGPISCSSPSWRASSFRATSGAGGASGAPGVSWDSTSRSTWTSTSCS